MIEKVKIREPEEAWAQVLKDWREDEDRVARAQNALLKYYKRIQPKEPVVLTVLVAA